MFCILKEYLVDLDDELNNAFRTEFELTVYLVSKKRPITQIHLFMSDKYDNQTRLTMVTHATCCTHTKSRR